MGHSDAPRKPRFFQPLVEKKPPKTVVPVVVGHSKARFEHEQKTLTGKSPIKTGASLRTPPKQILKAGDNPVITKTPNGSELVYSPSKHLHVKITTPKGVNQRIEDLYLLVRHQDYITKNPSSVLNALHQHPSHLAKELFPVIATNETRKNQPKRKTQRRERAAVGNSAKNILIDFFKRQGIVFSEDQITAEKWELCHLLSYAIAKNALDSDGKPFDTQVAHNLFAGTRVLNENMMRIENVLLELINKNEIASLEFQAMPTALNNAHVLSTLTLNARITTHDGATIEFDIEYDALTENRKLSHETSTCYYAFFKGIIADQHARTVGVKHKRDDEDSELPPIAQPKFD